ncbi:MAG: hypothetical protein AABY46_07660 [Nitrospirota bacterium]
MVATGEHEEAAEDPLGGDLREDPSEAHVEFMEQAGEALTSAQVDLIDIIGDGNLVTDERKKLLRVLTGVSEVAGAIDQIQNEDAIGRQRSKTLFDNMIRFAPDISRLFTTLLDQKHEHKDKTGVDPYGTRTNIYEGLEDENNPYLIQFNCGCEKIGVGHTQHTSRPCKFKAQFATISKGIEAGWDLGKNPPETLRCPDCVAGDDLAKAV